MNRVTLMGHLGMDPVVGQTARSVPFAGVVLRTCERVNDAGAGVAGEAAQWHRIVVFGGKAKLVAETLRRGSPAVFEGRLRTRRWMGEDGMVRQETVVVCEEVHLFFRTGFDEAVPDGLADDWPGEEVAA